MTTLQRSDPGHSWRGGGAIDEEAEREGHGVIPVAKGPQTSILGLHRHVDTGAVAPRRQWREKSPAATGLSRKPRSAGNRMAPLVRPRACDAATLRGALFRALDGVQHRHTPRTMLCFHTSHSYPCFSVPQMKLSSALIFPCTLDAERDDPHRDRHGCSASDSGPRDGTGSASCARRRAVIDAGILASRPHRFLSSLYLHC